MNQKEIDTIQENQHSSEITKYYFVKWNNVVHIYTENR